MTYSAKAQDNKEIITCDTMLELLENLCIFSIYRENSNKYFIGEECDQNYWTTITNDHNIYNSNN